MTSIVGVVSSRVLWRLAVVAFILVPILVGGLEAAAHPNHASTLEVHERDGFVEFVASMPVEAFEAATGLSIDPEGLDTLAVAETVRAASQVTGSDGSPWLLEVGEVTVRTRGITSALVVDMSARPPSGAMPAMVRLTYGLLVDALPDHRVVVATAAETIGTIDGDHRALEIPLGGPSVDPELGAASVELEAAGIPGAIGDVVIGRGRATVWVALLAAIGLGAVHAVAPGHGKTLTAAYLVGSRGTRRHAVLLGLTTSVSHTVGVALLGVATLAAAETFDSALVYSALGTVSGVAITGIGVVLLLRSLGRRGAAHTHPHAHGDHDHAHHHHGDGTRETLRWGSLAGLGLAGGMVPSASAVVLLLVAVRLGRAELGLLLVALFGVGMATVLVGSGLLVLRGEGAMRAVVTRRWGSGTLRRLSVVASPVAAAAVTVVGIVWTVQAVV